MIISKTNMKKNQRRQGSSDTTSLSSGSLRSPEESSARRGWSYVCVRKKFKRQLKKKCKTIDKLTDLLSRYEKTLTEKKENNYGWTVRDQSDDYPKMEPITNLSETEPHW